MTSLLDYHLRVKARSCGISWLGIKVLQLRVVSWMVWPSIWAFRLRLQLKCDTCKSGPIKTLPKKQISQLLQKIASFWSVSLLLWPQVFSHSTSVSSGPRWPMMRGTSWPSRPWAWRRSWRTSSPSSTCSSLARPTKWTELSYSRRF